jgi:hypothetical protein
LSKPEAPYELLRYLFLEDKRPTWRFEAALTSLALKAPDEFKEKLVEDLLAMYTISTNAQERGNIHNQVDSLGRSMMLPLKTMLKITKTVYDHESPYDSFVRYWLANNKELTGSECYEVATSGAKCADSLLRRHAGDETVLEELVISAKTSTQISDLLANTKLSEKQIRYLYKKPPDSNTWMYGCFLAANNLPEDILLHMISSGQIDQGKAIKAPNCPGRIIEEYYNSGVFIRYSVPTIAAHKNTPVGILKRILADFRSYRVRINMLNNPNLPDKLRTHIGKTKNYKVKRGMANCVYTPDFVLAQLAMSDDPIAKQDARKTLAKKAASY